MFVATTWDERYPVLCMSLAEPTEKQYYGYTYLDIPDELYNEFNTVTERLYEIEDQISDLEKKVNNK